MNKYKATLLRIGNEIGEKIQEIKRLQKEIVLALKDSTPEEVEELYNDPKIKKLYDNLDTKLDEIW